MKQSLFEFWEEFFPPSVRKIELQDLPFFLGAMLFATQWKGMVSELQLTYSDQTENISKILVLVDKMQEAFYKFTNQKLKIFLVIPELSFLLKHYLKENPDGLSNIYKEWINAIYKGNI